jgi:hypothetical protein
VGVRRVAQRALPRCREEADLRRHLALGGHLISPFTPENVVDLRDLARYRERMDETFPIRRFVVMGVRSDQTGRALGPMERRDVPAAVERLADTGEFASVISRDVTRQR